jgi:hypothetical protein
MERPSPVKEQECLPDPAYGQGILCNARDWPSTLSRWRHGFESRWGCAEQLSKARSSWRTHPISVGIAHSPIMGFVVKWKMDMEAKVTPLVETDDRSRVVIPGHPNQRYLLQENSDGSILLEPARVVSEAQYEYDNTPELRELLTRAASSGYVTHRRQRA